MKHVAWTPQRWPGHKKATSKEAHPEEAEQQFTGQAKEGVVLTQDAWAWVWPQDVPRPPGLAAFRATGPGEDAAHVPGDLSFPARVDG